MPAWQSQDYIDDCLESIQNQDYFKENDNWEILIGVDRCKKLKSHLSKTEVSLKNTKIFWFYNHSGPYVIRNTLAYKSKYDKILFFDSDDIMEPFLVDMLIEKSTNADIIRYREVRYDIKKDKEEGQIKICYGQFFIWKEKFKELGGFFPWPCEADHEFLKRAGWNNFNIKEVRDKIYIWRPIHGNNITSRKETGMRSELRLQLREQIKQNRKNKIKHIEPIFSRYKMLRK